MIDIHSIAQVTDPFWSYLKQGANPSKLSRSAAVGFSIGICPLIGKYFQRRSVQLDSNYIISRAHRQKLIKLYITSVNLAASGATRNLCTMLEQGEAMRLCSLLRQLKKFLRRHV